MYYTMGEVSEMFDVKPSLLRYWEGQFSELKPKKNKKGNRLFTPKDIEWLKLIYHLVKERGMTLEGARKSLKQNKSEISRDSELLERLQKVRALLVEVREDLKAGEDEMIVEGDEISETKLGQQVEPQIAEEPIRQPVTEEPKAESKPKTKRKKESVMEPSTPELIAVPVEEPEQTQEQESATEEPKPIDSVEIKPQTVVEPEAKAAAERPARRTRARKERKSVDKELFAFYEQSLFQSSNED